LFSENITNQTKILGSNVGAHLASRHFSMAIFNKLSTETAIYIPWLHLSFAGGVPFYNFLKPTYTFCKNKKSY
jgi:hypothetical protein